MIENYMNILNILVAYVEIVLNTISFCIVIFSIVKGLIKEYKKMGKAKHVICKGISDALNYNLATEVLKIIVGRGLKDLVTIGGILVLKAMITCLFMLEMKQDEMRDRILKKTNSKINSKINSKNS